MPSSSSNKEELRGKLDRAIRLSRSGKRREALQALERLTRSHPKSAAVAGYLGGLYLDSNQPQKAISLFRRATELSPKSELASVGLFHSLWETDAVTDAFEEMRRFLRHSDSPEYAKLLRDLTVEGRLVPQMA